jgi:hypothetical protein
MWLWVPAFAETSGIDVDPSKRARRNYLIALMRSSAPFGQSLPYFST